MGELGFGQSRLYLQFFAIDGNCTPAILDITEIPDLPDADMADALMRFCDQTLEEVMEPGTRVGILYARPGGRSPGLPTSPGRGSSPKRPDGTASPSTRCTSPTTRS